MTSDKYLVFDSGYRGWCNLELTDCKAFAGWLSYNCPWVIFVHVPNEGKRLGSVADLVEAGMVIGCADYVFLTPGFTHTNGVIEGKRTDRTKSAWRKGQREFLQRVVDSGGFAAVAYGFECMKSAAKIYLCGSDDDATFAQYLAQHNEV